MCVSLRKMDWLPLSSNRAPGIVSGFLLCMLLPTLPNRVTFSIGQPFAQLLRSLASTKKRWIIKLSLAAYGATKWSARFSLWLLIVPAERRPSCLQLLCLYSIHSWFTSYSCAYHEITLIWIFNFFVFNFFKQLYAMNNIKRILPNIKLVHNQRFICRSMRIFYKLG